VQTIKAAQEGSEAISHIRAVTVLPPSQGLSLDHIPRSATDLSRVFGGFDCIVTDFNMLPMTGLQLLQAVRTGHTKAPRATPTIILTGHADDHLVAAALALDANAFVVKPVSRTSLLEKIRRAMSTPINLKPGKAYAEVTVPEAIGGVRRASDQSIEAPFVGQDVPPVADGRTELLPLAEITEGMMLATDVKGQSGAVLIPGGTQFGKELLAKLGDLRELGGIGEVLWIRRRELNAEKS
jgi:CheY-like chemotaxis protein